MNPTPQNFPSEPPQSPPDDGDFSHPAYDNLAIAKGLYEDAGIDWPDWLEPEAQDNPDNMGDDNNGGSDTSSDSDPVHSGDTDGGTSSDDTSDHIVIGTRQLPMEQANTLLAWHDYLSSHPEKAETIGKIVRGEVIPPPPTPPTPPPTQNTQSAPDDLPEGFDPDDPMHRFMLAQMNSMKKSMSEMSNQVREQSEAQARQRANADMSQALSRFRNEHPDLDDAEINSIRQKAAELGIVGSLVRQNASDPVSGILKSLEAGMWNVPSVRDKLYNAQSQSSQSTKSQSRQSKLSALSGSSGSRQRTEPPPMLDSDKSMKDAIAKAVAPMFNTN